MRSNLLILLEVVLVHCALIFLLLFWWNPKNLDEALGGVRLSNKATLSANSLPQGGNNFYANNSFKATFIELSLADKKDSHFSSQSMAQAVVEDAINANKQATFLKDEKSLRTENYGVPSKSTLNTHEVKTKIHTERFERNKAPEVNSLKDEALVNTSLAKPVPSQKNKSSLKTEPKYNPKSKDVVVASVSKDLANEKTLKNKSDVSRGQTLDNKGFISSSNHSSATSLTKVTDLKVEAKNNLHSEAQAEKSTNNDTFNATNTQGRGFSTNTNNDIDATNLVPLVTEGELKLLASRKLNYPSICHQRGLSGRVELELSIGVDGVVRYVKVLKDAPRCRLFTAEAISYAKSRRYATLPSKFKNGVKVKLGVNFTLD